MKLNIQLFAYDTPVATIESQSSTGTGGYRHKILLLYYFNVDESARTYTIYAKEQFYHKVTDDNWSNGSPYNRLIIDDVVKATTTNNLGSPTGEGTFDLCPSFKGNSWQNMGTYNYDVNGNGTTHTLGVSCGYASSWAGIKRKTTYHNVTPPTISPASSPISNISDITLGNAPSVTWTPYVSTYKFKIKYTSGNGAASYTTPNYITPNQTTSYTYSGDVLTLATFASQISGTTDTFTATLYTYNSSNTLLGTSSKTFRVTLPSSVKPSVSNVVISDVGGLVPSSWGVYVKSKSKIKGVITASGSYGSTITRYNANISNLFTYSGSSNQFTTTNYLTKVGENTISVSATDSRNRTSDNYNVTYNAVDYNNPSILTIESKRVNLSGVEDDQGTRIKYTFNASVSPVSNHNTPYYKLSYHEVGSSTWYTVAEWGGSAGSNYSINQTATIDNQGGDFDTTKEYEFMFEAWDYFNTSNHTILTREVGTGFDLMNFNPSGKSMAIGQVSTRNSNETALDIALRTYFTENIDIDGIVTATEFNGNLNGNASTASSAGSATNAGYASSAGTAGSTTGTLTIKQDGITLNTFNGSQNKEINITGINIANKILWEDSEGKYMHSGQRANLSERVSQQRNGIILVWQAYTPGSGLENYWMNYTFVPKWQTAYREGYGVCCFCSGINFEKTAVKYVYVNDDSVVGNDNNTSNGTQSSINYNADRFVLVAVLGV